MQKLDRSTLHSLEEYATIRDDFRREVIAHKKPRRIAVTTNAVLYFEDFTTMKYQVQEMLRAERIFEADGIQDEIDAYNPLIPDGSNLKATFMLEYPDVDERRVRLGELVGIEDKTYVQVGDLARSYAISDEDLERSTDEKTSSVHFCRFELDAEMIAAAKAGADIKVGIEHPNLTAELTLPTDSRDSLAADLEAPH